MVTRSNKKASRKTSSRTNGAGQAAARDASATRPPIERDASIGEDDTSRPRRFIARLRKDGMPAATSNFYKSAGMRVVSTADFDEGAIAAEDIGDADVIILDKLGMAIIEAPEDQVGALNVEEGGPFVSIRPERTFVIMGGEVAALSGDYGTGAGGLFEEAPGSGLRGVGLNFTVDYLRGYQIGINRLIDDLTGSNNVTDSAGIAATPDQSQATWGLQAVRALSTPLTGRGVRVAVLDTGIDLTHPDFAGRQITSRSFLQGVPGAQDGNGHGTHCAGTVCGPLRPSRLPRYGVAPDVELFVGKVLRDNGRGPESGILSGINWALTQGCRIISMSLGSSVGIGEPPDDDYEEIGRIALDNNCLIIAAAGNDSSRPGSIRPVGIPANSASIMAVAALQFAGNQQFRIASFSNGGINPGGGKVDIAAPGVAVYSSWSTSAFGPTPSSPSRPPTGTRYHTISGTSMATPHVAGVAALLMEQTPAATADQVMQRLTQTATALPLPSRDVGSGIVQAPSGA